MSICYDCNMLSLKYCGVYASFTRAQASLCAATFCFQQSFNRRFAKISQSQRRPLPTMAFSWLETPTSTFPFKTLLRQFAKHVLTHRVSRRKIGTLMQEQILILSAQRLNVEALGGAFSVILISSRTFIEALKFRIPCNNTTAANTNIRVAETRQAEAEEAGGARQVRLRPRAHGRPQRRLLPHGKQPSAWLQFYCILILSTLRYNMCELQSVQLAAAACCDPVFRENTELSLS